MQPIRVKVCQESDLRMLGNLARNIQRVLPVTQADIDAAAALGKEWVVWKVIEVSDPIDNLRGGTQLVIKQNSITPGQNVRRVLIVQGPGGQTVVIGPAPSPLLLPDAIADSLSYVKAFGGTYQGLPSGYTPLEYIEMTGAQYLDTGITGYANTNVLKTKINASQVSATCFITFQNPNSGEDNLGLFLSSSRWNFQYGSPSRVTALASANTDVSIEATNGIMKINGVSVTGTPASEFSISEPILIGTAINGTTIEGRKFQGKIYYFRWEDSNGNVLFDGVPAKDSNNVAGMYDTVSGRFLTNQGSGSITAGPAVTPTPTPDAPMNIVCNNGTIKVRRQSGLPLDYQKITFVRPDESVDFGIKTTNNTQITTEFYREANIAQYLYLSDTGSALTTNTTAYTSTGSANWRFGNRTANVTTPVTTKTTYVQNKNGVSRTSPTEDSWDYSSVNSFTSTDNLRTGASPSGETEGNIRYYSMLVEESGVAVLDLIPVRRLSDDKVGFYNLVNGDFFEATGNVIRGGDIADPIEIYADGTVETINAYGKNLFNKNSSLVNGYINSSGAVVLDSALKISPFIEIKPNTTYTLSGTGNVKVLSYDRYAYTYTAEQTPIAQIPSKTGGASVTFTTAQNAKYIRIQMTPDAVNTCQLELGSTATDYQPYYNGGTATAEMLLKVGDYTDVQEILSGKVKRNVGVKVFDGTENFTVVNNTFRYSLIDLLKNTKMICSHFNGDVSPSVLTSNQPDLTVKNNAVNNNNAYFKYAAKTTVESFQQWLADQYAAGTPVIVVYPLATETTESVTGQTLQVQAGDNTLTITQASLDGLELEAEYEQGVQALVEEIEP